MTLYADDADAWVEDQVTDTRGNDLDFEPVVKSGDVTLPAAWQDEVGPTRVLRTTVGGQGLAPGVTHPLRLLNPNGNDVALEAVYLFTR